MNLKYTCYLIGLSKGQDIFSEFTVKTTELMDLFEKSQQSVSRILIEMEQQELISRHSSPRGIRIKFEDKGLEQLKMVKDCLADKFEKELKFQGKVTQGFGEGKYYITRQGYQKQFKQKLGMVPYPGTMNMKTDEKYRSIIRSTFPRIVIEGFKTHERSFSPLECYKCKVNGEIDSYVIFIERTNHPDNIIEIISEVYLRDKIKGNIITVEMGE